MLLVLSHVFQKQQDVRACSAIAVSGSVYSSASCRSRNEQVQPNSGISLSFGSSSVFIPRLGETTFAARRQNLSALCYTRFQPSVWHCKFYVKCATFLDHVSEKVKLVWKNINGNNHSASLVTVSLLDQHRLKHQRIATVCANDPSHGAYFAM